MSLLNLTWHGVKLRRLENRVFERIFVEDVGHLRVLGGRGRGVQLKRREAEVLFWETVIAHLQIEERLKSVRTTE